MYKKEGTEVDILEAKAGTCEINDVHDEVSRLLGRYAVSVGK